MVALLPSNGIMEYFNQKNPQNVMKWFFVVFLKSFHSLISGLLIKKVGGCVFFLLPI